ncbi:hypothetical protein DFAR_1260014 [Desulfarculales bacterium]
MDTASFSRAVLTKFIRKQVLEIAQDRKKQPVLIIDEVPILRLEILTELHTITQFQGNSKSILPIILAGQNNLADLLIYRTYLPLASRIVARSHLAGVSLQNTQAYFLHQLRIVASSRTSSLIQPSPPYSRAPAGLFRRANHLTRGAIMAAAEEQAQVVSPKHVRIHATELI